MERGGDDEEEGGGVDNRFKIQFADYPELANGVVQEVVYRLAVELHDIGNLFGVGIEVKAEVNDFLLTPGKGGYTFFYVAGQFGALLFCDDVGFQR